MLLRIFWVLAFLSFFNSVWATSWLSTETQNLDRLWQRVLQAEESKLPKTALKVLEEILDKTKNEDELRGHYLKALCWRALNQAHIQGKKPLDKLNILRQQIDSLPKNQLAMARAIMAIWYWHYYQQNTWKFNKRSQTSGLENEDISTWDSPKLFRKVAALFNEAVKDKKHLQGLKTEDYVPVIKKGSLDWTYCESLYEFLLRQKISFHKFGISSLAKPSDAFEIDTRSPAFSDLHKFLEFRPETADTQSQLFQLIDLISNYLAI